MATSSFGVRHRQRPQQERVDEREDRRVRANGDGERQHDDGREADVGAERAQGVERVLAQLREVVRALHGFLLLVVDVEHLGAHGVPVAELTERLGSRGGGVHAALDEAAHAHLEVKRQLGVHVALDSTRAEVEAEESPPNGRCAIGVGHQGATGAGARRAFPATSTKRCHDELPACSRVRPALARL